MIAGLALGLAFANTTDPLVRADQPIVERRYARLSGEGPAWGVQRSSSGTVHAWIFPDGMVEHAEFFRGKHVVEVRRYGPAGEALTTVRLTDDVPKEVIVSGPAAATIDVSTWEDKVIDGVHVRWPPADPVRHLDVTVDRSGADPRTDAFRDSLAAWCGCLVEDRDTAWLDGIPGVVYRVRLPHPDTAWTGEIWVVSDHTRAFVLASLVPADADGLPQGGAAAFAPGRAAAATVWFEGCPMIACDPRNTRAVDAASKLAQHLPEGVPGDDLWVVIGGDGYLLRTAAQNQFRSTYVGLNAGHLGFLLNDIDEAAWAEVARQISERSFSVHAFPLLHATVERADGTVSETKAINDVYLERMTSQAAHLQLTIDGHVVVQRLVADGVVFSTALGSTAYAFSAGGPVCHPTLQTLVVTPICPHRPRLASFALPATAKARVDILDGDRRPVRAVADGRAENEVRTVSIGYDGDAVRLGYLAGHDFTSRMVRKILNP